MLLGGNGLVVWAEQTVPSNLAALPAGCELISTVGAPRPLAAAIGHIAWDEFTAGRSSDPAEIDANYLRRSDAELFWKE